MNIDTTCAVLSCPLMFEVVFVFLGLRTPKMQDKWEVQKFYYGKKEKHTF